jgi:hypothetical protein
MTHVLSSPALLLLVDLEARGCSVLVEGADIVIRPAGSLTMVERRTLQAHYADARMLVLLSTDAGVQVRRDRFKSELAGAAPGIVPAMRFRVGVPYVAGVCFSCGTALDELIFGRCWRCALAWRLACGVPVFASTYDSAVLCT